VFALVASGPDPVVAAEPEIVAPPVIVTTGTRRDVPVDEAPVRVERIDAAEIRESGARDAAEVLETRLGVEIGRTFRGAGASVEGLDPKHVLVLVDGVRVAGRNGEQIDLSRIPVESIARIEVVRGAGSALYGSDALGGVIQIITKRAERPVEANVDLAYGTAETVMMTGSAGVRRERWDLSLSAGWHALSAYRLDDSPGTTGSARDDVTATLHGGVELSSALRLDARLGLVYRAIAGVDAQDLPPTFDGEPRWKITDREGTTWTINALTRAIWTPSPGSRGEIELSWSDYDDRVDYDQRGSEREDHAETSRDRIGQLDLRYQTLLGTSHVLSGGVDTQIELLTSDRLDAGEASRGRVGAYLQDEWTVLEDPALVLVPAVRLDADTQFGVAFTPRLAARLDPSPEVTLRADVGVGYRAPGFKELYLRFENQSVGYVVVGNPELEPERSIGTRAGVDWRPLAELKASLTVFRHDVSDLVLSVGVDDGDFSYVNVDSATSQGVELRLSLGPWSGLGLELGYGFTDARDDATDAQLQGRARHRASAAVTWRERDWGTTATARLAVTGTRPVADPNLTGEATDADPFATLDARLAQRLGDLGLSLFVGVDNALDAGDALTPLRPRMFYAGLSAHLDPEQEDSP